MPDRDNACKIQLVSPCQCPNVISCTCNVLKGAGPASTGIANTSVFDVPSRNTGISQSGRDGSHIVDGHGTLVHVSQLRHPASAVDHDGNWVGTLRGWHS